MGALKPQSNGPLYSNTAIGTLVVDGWTVTFGTARDRSKPGFAFSAASETDAENETAFSARNRNENKTATSFSTKDENENEINIQDADEVSVT